MRTVMTAVIAGAMAVSGITLAPAEAATTFRACVKKKTGETRMMTKKQTKCKKGWKKVTWAKQPAPGQAGPAGPAGAPGPAFGLGTVVDATGAEVGPLRGYTAVSATTGIFLVGSGDGNYLYESDGVLMPTFSPSFTDAACTGTPFVTASEEFLLAVLSEPTLRLVYRTDNLALPAQAYKVASSPVPISAVPKYFLDDVGACQASGTADGFRIDLVKVPTPPDRPGPLRVL